MIRKIQEKQITEGSITTQNHNIRIRHYGTDTNEIYVDNRKVAEVTIGADGVLKHKIYDAEELLSAFCQLYNEF